MEKQGHNKRSVTRVFGGKNKPLAKHFGKTTALNVTLMLTKCNLAFRGSSEGLSKDNKSNFLSIIQLLAKHDPVLDKLLQLLKGSPKYLRLLIQNELISVLAKEVLRDIKSELQSATFFCHCSCNHSKCQQKRQVK